MVTISLQLVQRALHSLTITRLSSIEVRRHLYLVDSPIFNRVRLSPTSTWKKISAWPLRRSPLRPRLVHQRCSAQNFVPSMFPHWSIDRWSDSPPTIAVYYWRNASPCWANHWYFIRFRNVRLPIVAHNYASITFSNDHMVVKLFSIIHSCKFIIAYSLELRLVSFMADKTGHLTFPSPRHKTHSFISHPAEITKENLSPRERERARGRVNSGGNRICQWKSPPISDRKPASSFHPLPMELLIELANVKYESRQTDSERNRSIPGDRQLLTTCKEKSIKSISIIVVLVQNTEGERGSKAN